MGIPNMITMLRIVLTPLFVRFYLEGQQGAAMAVLFAAAMSDMLDGFIARRFHMITPLGKVLDPVADKLLQLGMLLCLADRGAIVWLLLLLHLMRELSLFALGGLVYRRCGLLIGARWYGKLCTGLMYAALGAALLWRDMPRTLLEPAAALCAVLVLCCFFGYAGEYLRILREQRKEKPNQSPAKRA